MSVRNPRIMARRAERRAAAARAAAVERAWSRYVATVPGTDAAAVALAAVVAAEQVSA